jgi:hypothetical protein
VRSVLTASALALTLALAAACGGEETTAPANNNEIGLAVRLVNTGQEDLYVITQSPNSIDVCYKDIGCEVVNSDGSPNFQWIATSGLVQMSNPDTVAVGMRVRFIVREGQGRAEVIRGTAFRSSSSLSLHFAEGPIVHTSAAFAAGDTVRFTYGIVD